MFSAHVLRDNLHQLDKIEAWAACLHCMVLCIQLDYSIQEGGKGLATEACRDI